MIHEWIKGRIFKFAMSLLLKNNCVSRIISSNNDKLCKVIIDVDSKNLFHKKMMRNEEHFMEASRMTYFS